MPDGFYTIGHSTRAISEFIELLRDAGVALLADVRAVPRSRTNPQFNREVLPEALVSAGIAYRHLAALGGLRGKSRTIPPERNAFWRNQSFHNFADYAMTEPFRAGLADLLAWGGGEQRCAIFCAEAVWWRCHRRIIADYLVALGESVFHLVGSSVEPAHLTGAARVSDAGVLTYPSAA